MKQYISSIIFVFALVFVLGGCVSKTGLWGSEQERALSSQYDDAGIKTSITSALLKNSATKANDVDIHCFKGHVFLVGEADKDFRQFALETARSAEGVVHVTTHWFPTGSASTADDAALKAAIAKEMGTIATSPVAQVAVDVWGGNVVLLGILPTQAEINQMIGIARKGAGTKSVTSYLVPN